MDRTPLNSKYCKKVNCHLRSGNKCTVESCTQMGGDKWAAYFITYGHLPDEE